MGFKGELRSNSTLNLVTTMFVHWRDTAVDFSFKWMEDNKMTMKSLTREKKKQDNFCLIGVQHSRGMWHQTHKLKSINCIDVDTCNFRRYV